MALYQIAVLYMICINGNIENMKWCVQKHYKTFGSLHRDQNIENTKNCVQIIIFKSPSNYTTKNLHDDINIF